MHLSTERMNSEQGLSLCLLSSMVEHTAQEPRHTLLVEQHTWLEPRTPLLVGPHTAQEQHRSLPQLVVARTELFPLLEALHKLVVADSLGLQFRTAHQLVLELGDSAPHQDPTFEQWPNLQTQQTKFGHHH